MAYERSYNTIDLQPDVAVGIKLPFVTEGGRLFPLSYTTEEQALSNLKNLILTRRGERLMEPLFGTSIQDFLFEPYTTRLTEKIQNEIYTAVDFWLPYIIIKQLTVSEVSVGTSNTYGVTLSLVVEVENGNSETPITFLITNSIMETI